jgi:hypothetical protein
LRGRFSISSLSFGSMTCLLVAGPAIRGRGALSLVFRNFPLISGLTLAAALALFSSLSARLSRNAFSI